MRQVTQRPRDGRVAVSEVPPPVLRPGWVLVANRCSLISAGTERSKIELGDKNLLQKARARPDLARKVVDRARVEGVGSAIQVTRRPPRRARATRLLVRRRRRAGRKGVTGVAPGDRVACAGAGWANHAELVAVPRNLSPGCPRA